MKKLLFTLFSILGLLSPGFSEEPEMHPLFNGKDLTGWTVKSYEVEDGSLIVAPNGGADNLLTTSTYASFILDFDFKLTPGANNGLGINYDGSGDAAYKAIELQILDNPAQIYHSYPLARTLGVVLGSTLLIVLLVKFTGLFAWAMRWFAKDQYTRKVPPAVWAVVGIGFLLFVINNIVYKRSPHDLQPEQYHGSAYKLAAAKQEGLKPAGEWNHQRVTQNGSNLSVQLNGIEILKTNLDELQKAFPKHEGVKRRAGHLGFLGHGSRVDFRHIKIHEIAPPADEVALKSAGFTKIFDGKTLNGWKVTPASNEWTVVDSLLKQTGKTSDLWSEKEYGDVTLSLDWRWTGRGELKPQPEIQPDGSEKETKKKIEEMDSGIYLRGNTKSQVNLWNWSVGSGEVYGYRTDPKMSAEVRAGVTPKLKADKPQGEWNHADVTLKGDRLTVVLNGKTVIENAQLPGVPATGALGLQHHGQAIEFANIWVKELK